MEYTFLSLTTSNLYLSLKDALVFFSLLFMLRSNFGNSVLTFRKQCIGEIEIFRPEEKV